ncbi:hypothetical protein U0070_002603 [Myodes glareolus]|uniref:Uncharacterized protein n=1 Tax=Myodes glareolus TaxID=447135 RepID=A0AAW0HR05_MYOGA
MSWSCLYGAAFEKPKFMPAPKGKTISVGVPVLPREEWGRPCEDLSITHLASETSKLNMSPGTLPSPLVHTQLCSEPCKGRGCVSTGHCKVMRVTMSRTIFLELLTMVQWMQKQTETQSVGLAVLDLSLPLGYSIVSAEDKDRAEMSGWSPENHWERCAEKDQGMPMLYLEELKLSSFPGVFPVWLCFGLGQKLDTLNDEDRDPCVQRLNNILEYMEEYMKPIAPLFTFPDFPGAASFLSPGDGQLSLAEAGARDCCPWATSPTVTRIFPEPQERSAPTPDLDSKVPV